MKVINLVGGPCCGKSTTAAGLFAAMKLDMKYKCEQVTEVIKDYVYDNNEMAMKDQVLLTAEQGHKLFRLDGKVDYAISDASLINGVIYNIFYKSESDISDKLALDLFNQYDNIVFLLPRKTKYDQYGRTQSEDEAKDIDQIFLTVLEAYRVPYYDMRQYSHEEMPQRILEIIKELDK